MKLPIKLRQLSILLLAGGSVFLAACDSPQNELATPVAGDDAEQRGRTLFESLCSDCHPRTGRGDYLKRIPATLLTRRSDSELQVWIRGVDQHRDMPSFVDLNQRQLDDLVAFLNAEIEH